MCGIAGYFGRLHGKMVRLMLSRLRHRGKDFSSALDLGFGSVGHNLHAVVGFVPQPLVDGDFWFVGNLEIYNWRELARKYSIDARNDAELAFELLMKKESKAFELFDGIFAIAFGEGKDFMLARDSFGVLPLFYSLKPLAFASERMLNMIELHPRHRLYFEDLELVKDEYIPLRQEIKKIDEETAAERLRKLLEKAVRKRIPDFELALFFSGGIDSLVLAYLLKSLDASFKAYCACTKGSFDFTYARKVAGELGIKLEIVEIKNVRELALKVADAIKEADIVKIEAGIPLLASALKAKEKIGFSGLGADELFCGYKRMLIDCEKESLSWLRQIYERNTYRDNVLAFLGGVELRLPYLDRELAEFALSLPKELKYKQGYRKWILRRAFEEELGKLVWVKKKAAQYSSGVSKHRNYRIKRIGKRVGALISGGKDSIFALHVAHRLGYDIACLINIKSRNPDSYMFHSVLSEAVPLQAKAMGIPLIQVESEGKKEEELKDLEKALRIAKEKYRIEMVVAGAIASRYQKYRIEEVAERVGLAVFTPLWGREPESYLRQVARELKFAIVRVSAMGLGEEWVGRVIGKKEAEKLIELGRKFGFRADGEGGEYETLVLHAPLFKKRIEGKLLKLLRDQLRK